jgi:hypothetical protein
MKFDWILHPLIYYFLLAVAMSLCLYLFLAVQRQIQAAETRAGRDAQKLRSELLGLELELARLRGELEEKAVAAAPSLAPQPAMNLNRRTQALRMARRGDRPDQIAAALQIPDSEVNLLLKVHRTVSEVGSLKALDGAVSGHGHDVLAAGGAAARA